MKRWFYISTKHSTFAISSKDGFVYDTPPIANWMHGFVLQNIRNYLIKNKAKVIEYANKKN